MTREFTISAAVRESVPLLVGIMGPSGGGKTFSALRLATGIQSVTGGDIVGIDTEARRMLHYADRFKFKHMPFTAPFASLDYLAAIQQAVRDGAKTVIVDSMSHEHEGPGGLLEYHERELDRLAGNDWSKRDRVKMLAWQKPKSERRTLINSILQIPANFVFCFRAKEKVKLVKGSVIPQGWMPIAGEEFVFEMTTCCLLPPHSGGKPTWQSDEPGERMMMKLPEQFRDIFADSVPLSEDIGAALATWASGGQVRHTDDGVQDWINSARFAATRGSAELAKFWKTIPAKHRAALKAIGDELRGTATEADAMVQTQESSKSVEDVI